MPCAAEKINAILDYTLGAIWRDELNWGTKPNGAKVAPALVLFPLAQNTNLKSGGHHIISLFSVGQ